MPLSTNLFQLESSILTRAKQATNRNNVATEKTNLKKKVLAPDSPGAQMSGVEMSSAQTAALKRTRPQRGNRLGIERGNGLRRERGNGLGRERGNGLGRERGNVLGRERGNGLGKERGKGDMGQAKYGLQLHFSG